MGEGGELGLEVGQIGESDDVVTFQDGGQPSIILSKDEDGAVETKGNTEFEVGVGVGRGEEKDGKGGEEYLLAGLEKKGLRVAVVGDFISVTGGVTQGSKDAGDSLSDG